MQTAELVFNHVFGIHEDMVSDWGPQFIAKVWKAFFTLLGVTLSLSSGYRRLDLSYEPSAMAARTLGTSS